MSFTGNENHDITLQDASEMTENYRDTLPAGGGILGHYFGKSAIQAILDQTNCVGIRIYYGLNGSGEKHLIVVGVDADENDLYQGFLAEKAISCPPVCGISNPLNS